MSRASVILFQRRLVSWLTDPGPDIPPSIRTALLGQLLASLSAVVMGAINGLIVNVVAVAVHESGIFYFFAVLEVLCFIGRVVVIQDVLRKRREGVLPPMEAAVSMSILWCTLQGVVAFSAMETGNPTLQLLAAIQILGIIGPICARNYPAPRLSLLLICVLDLPFGLGACMSGQALLLILIPMTPPYIFGMMQIVHSLNRLAVSALRSEAESADRARRDTLTGIGNRLAFEEQLETSSIEGSEKLTLMCLDLDGFKLVNDKLGHHAGDLVLRAVALRLNESLRMGDSVFRLGGDEFVVLSARLTPNDAEILARRLIEHVSAETYSFKGLPPIRIGVSIGYACAPEDCGNTTGLLRMADAALYASKAAGKGVYRRACDLRVAA